MENILNNVRGALRLISNGRKDNIPLLYTYGVNKEGNGYRVHLAYYKVEGSHELLQVFVNIKRVDGQLKGTLSVHGYGGTDRNYEVTDQTMMTTIYNYAETIIEDTEEDDLDAIAKIMKTDIDLTNDDIEPHTFL
jgi:hypothetical protein